MWNDSEIEEVNQNTLPQFISSRQICVLSAQTNFELGFNYILKTQLQHRFQDRINLGLMDLSKVDHNNRTINEFVKTWMPKIGLPPSNSIFPGYYLFKNGKLIAHHAGTIDRSEVDANLQGMAAIIGAITGLIVGIAEKDTWKGLEAFLKTMEAPQAFKVLTFFTQVLGEKNSSESRQRQEEVFSDELENAYKLLGVTPSATDEEIKKAWKSLQLKFHPDMTQDSNEKERRTKLIAEINNARDLIKKTRAKKKNN